MAKDLSGSLIPKTSDDQYAETVIQENAGHKTIGVSTSAVECTTGAVEKRTAILLAADEDNTADIFIGFGSGVTAGTGSGTTMGFRLIPGKSIPIQVAQRDVLKLYAIAESGTQYLTVIEGR